MDYSTRVATATAEITAALSRLLKLAERIDGFSQEAGESWAQQGFANSLWNRRLEAESAAIQAALTKANRG